MFRQKEPLASLVSEMTQTAGDPDTNLFPSFMSRPTKFSKQLFSPA